MPKSADIEKAIARLATLRLAPRSAEARKELAGALAGKNGFLIERAAQFVRDFKLAELAPDLARAFLRQMSGHEDRGCAARIALASALYDLDAQTPEVYLAGIHCFEGSSNPVDPSAALRGLCAMGLMRIGHRNAMREVTDLLADPKPPARIGAARALGMAGRSEAALLLRLKLHLGDPDPEVVGECLAAIVQVDPAESIELVGRYLYDSNEAIAESAALALGESRRPDALNMLIEHYRSCVSAVARGPILLAIAITRLPEAPAFLLSQLEACDPRTATQVLEALRIYRHDDAIRAAALEHVERRRDPAVRRKFAEMFER